MQQNPLSLLTRSHASATLQLSSLLGAVLLLSAAAVELWRDERPIVLLLLAGAAVLALLASSARTAKPRRKPEPIAEIEAAVSAHDLTSQIVLQLSRQQAADRGTRQQRTSLSSQAWGDLMARVSHDMRTPLNAVIGFSDVMTAELFGPVGDARYREYIGHIRDSGRELLRSAEDTLAITSLIAGNAQGHGDVLDFGRLIAEARVVADAPAIMVHADDDLQVVGEKRALRQVLVNLMLEAAKRAGPAGRTTVQANAEDDFIVLQVSVADTGGRLASRAHEGSLHLCMARVLLELTGARLIEIERDNTWRAVTVLARANQPDFFVGTSSPALFAREPATPCLAN